MFGGIYDADIEYMDIIGDTYTATQTIQVLTRQPLKLEQNKVFMWIFSHDDFSVIDIVEIADYSITMDEETNAKSTLRVLQETNAEANDFVVFKKDNNILYWGIIEEIQNNSGENVYDYICRYITNMFDRQIELTDEALISSTGIEDFIVNAITENWIDNSDTFINLDYLDVTATTHTTKQTTVANVEDGIYNLHTWMTTCTQLYNVFYDFSIVNEKLTIEVGVKSINSEIIDIKAMNILNYREVFETDVVAKVTVLTSTTPYTLYLKTDRTTTTNPADENRAEGKITTVYTEDYLDAPQTALDVMKSNSYNHNISFSLDKYLELGTPIAIKTPNQAIRNTYISSIKITPQKFFDYQCGNIRINFIEKLLKEKK